MAFLASRSRGVSPKRAVMPWTTGMMVAARALAAGMRKARAKLTPNMPQMMRPTLEALILSRMARAMRLSMPKSWMMAPVKKANRHSQTSWVVNPEKTCPMGGLPLVQGRARVRTSRVGMEMPVMPTGMASETHMIEAQTRMASTDMPSRDKPSGRGKR